MPVRVACQHCGAKYQVREDKLGKSVRCQKCGETFTTSAPQRPASPAVEEIEPIAIDATPSPPEPVTPKDTATGTRFWKIAGLIAGLFVFSLMAGFLYAPAGMVLMMGWSFGGIGLILFGIVRLFMAMDGNQRFWMTLKILLRFVGLKLFYVDASLYNKKTLRAFAWVGTGFVLLFASFLPASHFLSRTREGLQAKIAENERKIDELGQNGAPEDPGLASHQPPDPFGPPAGGGFGNPGRMPPPGFGPPPAGNPGPGAGGPPPAALPISMIYESLDHPLNEIIDRVDRRFRSFQFYLPRSVRINPSIKTIEFLASSPPPRDELPRIREAFAEAGVKLRPRKSD